MWWRLSRYSIQYYAASERSLWGSSSSSVQTMAKPLLDSNHPGARRLSDRPAARFGDGTICAARPLAAMSVTLTLSMLVLV